MKIEGRYTRGRAEVRIDGKLLDPRRSQKVWNHSPDGFNWGYAGSGPGQLALAILLEAGLSNDEAIRLHHRFKFAYVQHLHDPFTVEIDVMAWAAEHQAARSPDVKEPW